MIPPSSIKEGRFYFTPGGRRRTVVAIGDEYKPNRPPPQHIAPNSTGVQFASNGVLYHEYLEVFARNVLG